MPKLKTYGRCFVAAVVLLLWACGEHKDDEWIPLQTPVQIVPRVQEPETKAPVGDSFANGDKIGVFGFYHDNSTWDDPDTPNVPNYMYNQLMTYNATTLAWEYSPVKYWPNETGPGAASEGTDLLSFWGYHPHNGSLPVGVTLNPVKSNGDSYTSASTGLPNIAFTQSTTTAGDTQVDLMVSDLVKDQTYEINSGVVVLPFSHALSKVDVNVKKKDPTSKYTVTLKNVSFNRIYHTGIIRWDALLETWDWANWSGPRQNLSVYSDDIVLTSDNHALPAVLPLPQSLTDASARLHVEFSVSYEGILHERSTTCEVLLSQVFEEAGAAWHKNSHYTLNITISPDDPIEFTVSWSDWGDAYNYHITD